MCSGVRGTVPAADAILTILASENQDLVVFLQMVLIYLLKAHQTHKNIQH